jgi:hypothetical protein
MSGGCHICGASWGSVLVGGVSDNWLRSSNDGGGGDVSVRDVRLLHGGSDLSDDGRLLVNGLVGHDDCSGARGCSPVLSS